jgi:hypothetical protein
MLLGLIENVLQKDKEGRAGGRDGRRKEARRGPLRKETSSQITHASSHKGQEQKEKSHTTTRPETSKATATVSMIIEGKTKNKLQQKTNRNIILSTKQEHQVEAEQPLGREQQE